MSCPVCNMLTYKFINTLYTKLVPIFSLPNPHLPYSYHTTRKTKRWEKAPVQRHAFIRGVAKNRSAAQKHGHAFKPNPTKPPQSNLTYKTLRNCYNKMVYYYNNVMGNCKESQSGRSIDQGKKEKYYVWTDTLGIKEGKLATAIHLCSQGIGIKTANDDTRSFAIESSDNWVKSSELDRVLDPAYEILRCGLLPSNSRSSLSSSARALDKYSSWEDEGETVDREGTGDEEDEVFMEDENASSKEKDAKDLLRGMETKGGVQESSGELYSLLCCSWLYRPGPMLILLFGEWGERRLLEWGQLQEIEACLLQKRWRGSEMTLARFSCSCSTSGSEEDGCTGQAADRLRVRFCGADSAWGALRARISSEWLLLTPLSS